MTIFVKVRKHPLGVPQPTGKFRVRRLEKVQHDRMEVGILDNGGWNISITNPPSFLDFVTDKGIPISTITALNMFTQ